MKYRRDIEGLRAIAVVAVLLYHFGVPGLDGGFVGVDVFFVISGYLITSLLIDERETKGRISIKAFYARRARRLLPISATVIVVTAIAGAVLMPATRLSDLAGEVTSAALFAANFLFAQRGTNYLTASLAPSPLRHYWSLAVEEQFYFIWPALIGVVTIGARNVRRRTAQAMGAIVVGSFGLSVLLTSASPSWSYFGLHTRAWELGLGALLAAVAPNTDRIPDRYRAALGWVGIAGIAVAVVTFGEVTVFPGWAAALPVLATGAILVAGNRTPRSPSFFMRHEPFVYLGTRSYSLYLWHWPVLVIAEARLDRTLHFSEKVLALALVFALAEMGYRFIEDPIRSYRPLARRPARSLAMGGGLVAVSLLAGVLLHNYHPDLSTGVVAAAPSAVVTTTTATPATTLPTADTAVVAPTSAPVATVPAGPVPIAMADTPVVQAIVDALTNDVVPDNVRPPVLNAKNDTGSIYDNGCHQYYASEVKPGCVFGDPNGTITVALWGDSHAAQWFSALDTIGKAHHWKLLALTQGGCPYLDIEVFNNHDNTVFHHCGAWRTAVRAYMREQGASFVFMSEFYSLSEASSRKPFSVAQWQAQIPALIASLRADGVEPIIIGDVPNPPKNVPDCVAKNRHQISACDARSDAAEASAINDALRAMAATDKVSFIEPPKWTCANGLCPVVVGDILVYRDGDHFTNTFIQWLTPLFEAVVAPFVDGVSAG